MTQKIVLHGSFPMAQTIFICYFDQRDVKGTYVCVDYTPQRIIKTGVHSNCNRTVTLHQHEKLGAL